MNVRSIPACAGEPYRLSVRKYEREVYPRVCGGTSGGVSPYPKKWGLSPRVRGNQLGRGYFYPHPGSIPACAGEPCISLPTLRRRRVYPRVCGGTQRRRQSFPPRAGLSPRVRGNPFRRIAIKAGRRVYPRVCGGTPLLLGHDRNMQGLSPRVRGNLTGRIAGMGAVGSIPACAGEPRAALSAGVRPGVYPRVCGGTACLLPVCACVRGLSPRVRGNQYHARVACKEPGSIPACAGEPPPRRCPATTEPVYPRVCGGTVIRLQSCDYPPGLSPRVRGNRPVGVHHGYPFGSIPACAGEPLSRRSWYSPRQGLSPRVRGNPLLEWPPDIPTGSIPACAGEPSSISIESDRIRVYPRVCGGTR